MPDSVVVLPAGARSAAPPLLEELRGPDYREVQRQYVADSLLISTDDRKRKERILKDMSSAPQHDMVSAMESLQDYDAAAVAEGCGAVPALYVAAAEPQPRTAVGRFPELVPQLGDGKTVGSGPFCQLEVPEQVNTMIERFLAVAPRDRSVAAT